jgi:ParB-like chromosome segregation protein Spo0J
MKKHKQVMMQVSKLKHIDRNARSHSPEQIQQITESLKKYGFVAPIVIDSKGTVYAGNGRLQAAKNLEMTEVPCVMMEGLSKSEMRAYALVDNRLSETSSWDKDILKIELEELALDIDLDLSVVGFSADEISKLLSDGIPDFVPDLGGDDDGGDAEKKIKLTVTFGSMSEMDDLFVELKNRGFKVKAG